MFLACISSPHSRTPSEAIYKKFIPGACGVGWGDVSRAVIGLNEPAINVFVEYFKVQVCNKEKNGKIGCDY